MCWRVFIKVILLGGAKELTPTKYLPKMTYTFERLYASFQQTETEKVSIVSRQNMRCNRFRDEASAAHKEWVGMRPMTCWGLILSFCFIVSATWVAFNLISSHEEVEIMHGRMFRPREIEAESDACQRERLNRINTMSSENDFIPYLCYNHNNQYLTVLGVHLNHFDLTQLKFFLNGHRLRDIKIHSGKKAFALNVAAKPEQLLKKREQVFSFSLNGCSYQMGCANYFEKEREELNLCVYTMRNRSVLEPFLGHYAAFVDRMFIYSTDPRSYNTLQPLQRQHKKYRVVPWYLGSLRDPNVSGKVYQELIQHNYRNYPRDLQKVQTNDCMYRNRNTNMLLMVDDDEFLNYLNRDFYRSLYQELKDKKDDIIFNRNFCNTTVEKNTQVSYVFDKTTTKCAMARKKRLEKAFVLPENCPLYEIHRCITYNSFSLSHLNIYATHRPYSLNRRKITEDRAQA